VRINCPILIVAQDIDTEPLATLIVNKLKSGFRIYAVKSPSYGGNRKATLEDIAISCGGQVVSEDFGMKLEKTNPLVLGTVKQVIITKDDTIIMHSVGSKAEIDNRISTLKEQTTTTFDKEKLEERITRLASSVAVKIKARRIKVGGASEIEVNELKDRINDALSATKAVSEEGIVVGGGMALLHCSKALDNLKGTNIHQDRGIQIVKEACKIPCKTICNNTKA
jgi:chaperonin GroEL